MLNAAINLIEEPEQLICEYCGATSGLRITADGGMFAFGFRIQPAQYTCADCFTGTDTGPSFDDLPLAEEFGL
ncbi:hypothetical protein [Mesorhizobium sp. B263B2A]|uniref:hypothetical protein n=1 Tax=Mesorhizobium sp. B263B2A TaxID=2876669 RepID=UPI001CD1231F|nr:hypothetical protein [Mesorhizobium sp. B263B2A]MCA0032707.1 hypothetical protein [Mesorhizobium sp. B263B2A]